MTVREAARKARETYKAHASELFDFLLLQVIVRLIPMTPLLFLLTPNLKMLSLLCVPLFLLIVPFVSERTAIGLQRALEGGSLSSRDLLNAEGYWKSVWNGLKKAFLLLLWLLPFIATTLWGYRVIFGSTVVGQTDVFSVISAISKLGGGDLVTGAVVAMLIYLATLLPFCFGLAFHSGDRHALALGDRKIIRGKRKKVIAAWLRSLLTIVPFAVVAGIAGGGYMSSLAAAVNKISGKGISIPKPDAGLYVILAAFVVLLLPLIPLKSLISAAMVRGIREEKNHAA